MVKKKNNYVSVELYLVQLLFSLTGNYLSNYYLQVWILSMRATTLSSRCPGELVGEPHESIMSIYFG